MKKNNKSRFLFFMFCSSLITLTACSSNDTPDLLPALSTTNVSEIMQNSAKSGGIITSDAGLNITARGVCWSTTLNPTIADNKTTDSIGIGSFTSSISNLLAGTTYYVRAYATNSSGTRYGIALSFKTLAAASTVNDIDGNVYHTLNIGTQTWMVENLKTTRYRNKESITNDTAAIYWNAATYGAWCDYKNDAAIGAIYGRLYNYAAIKDTRNIAPTGWHVATYAEWTTLITYLGGESVAAAKLKETGTNHWKSPNTGATNESGFTLLPGGARDSNGGFGSIGDKAYFWSSTENTSSPETVWYWYMSSDNTTAHKDYDSKLYGRSVRCIKD